MDAPGRWRRWMLSAVVTALAVRLLAAGGLQWVLDEVLERPFLIPGDADGYWHLAGDLAAGREYSIYEPPRHVLRMPGFPLVLALPRMVFGDSLLAARLLLAGVGTCACWGTGLLGTRLFDARVGAIACWLAAVSPALVGFAPLILSETTFAAVLVFHLYAAAQLVLPRSTQEAATDAGESPPTRSRLWWAVLTGALGGAAILVRPSWLLAVPGFALLHVGLRRPRLPAVRDAAVVLGAMLAVLLPWGLRNLNATGHFVLTTLWAGPSLYDGLNPSATGDSDMAFFDRENVLGAGMTEYEMNAHYRQRALEYAREHPGHVARLVLAKQLRYWKPWPNAEQFRSFWLSAMLAAFYVPMMVLSAAGFWKSRHSLWACLLTLGPAIYFSLIHSVFVSSLRYRLPAEYPLLILTAVGLCAVATRWSVLQEDG